MTMSSNNKNAGNKISREIQPGDDTNTLIKRIDDKISDFNKHKDVVQTEKETFRQYIKSLDGSKETHAELLKKIKYLQNIIAGQNELIDFYDDMTYLLVKTTKLYQAKEADLHRRWKEKQKHKKQSK